MSYGSADRVCWGLKAMKKIEVHTPPGLLKISLNALRPRKKPADPVERLPRVTYVIPRAILDGAHLDQYRKVCGFKAAQGVPLIYPQMLTFPLVMEFLASEHCPWPALGTVHLANTVEQYQTLHCGDVVRVEASSGDLIAHDKGQIFTLKLRIFRGDTLIWRATQSLLRTEVGNPHGTIYASSLDADLPLSRQADFQACASIGRRYGRMSGDINPIHLSALSARLFGFRRAIAHGMWTKARALAILLPDHPVDEASATVEFKTPLFLPGFATLWTHDNHNSQRFELRDALGQKPHLRGQLCIG
jgi:hypothetical protein